MQMEKWILSLLTADQTSLTQFIYLIGSTTGHACKMSATVRHHLTIMIITVAAARAAVAVMSASRQEMESWLERS